MAPTKMKTSSSKMQKAKQPRKLSVEELIQAAEYAVTAADPRHAITLYTVALQKPATSEQQQSVLLEKRAQVHVSLQNQEEALQDYQAALEKIVLDSDAPSVEVLERKAALHMYIGQLSVAADALASYQSGIECLRTALDATKEQQPLKQQLATACCSISELYLTDLCYEENAETECESYLQQALQLVADSRDALQTMASLRFSQNRGLEAVTYMMRVYAGMSTGCQALAGLVGLRDDPGEEMGATELLHFELVQNLPEFEFRCQTAKLLLECADALQKAEPSSSSSSSSSLTEEQKQQQPGECAQAAVDVLGSLLAENDEVVEVWTLLGDALVFLDKEQSCQYWERALEMLAVVQESLVEEQRQTDGMDDQEDDDEVQHQLDEVVCQMEDLRAKLEEARAGVENGDAAMAE